MAIDNRGGIFIGGNNSGVNTINNGPVPRNLDNLASLRAQILNSLPRDKPITVMAVLGDVEAIQLAQQIHAFMKENSFVMAEADGISQGVFTTPIKGLQFNSDNNTLIIGANLP
jgi:hypothetical protein